MPINPTDSAIAMREMMRGLAGRAYLGAMQNVMTDPGDIIVGGVGGSPLKVTKGSDGQIMKVVSGSPAWSASTHSSTHATGQADAITPLSIGASSIMSATETKTVHQTNPAADFTTINAALAYFANRYPGYTQGGLACTINLLSGFVMSEYVKISGIDLGFVTITGVDAETVITRSALGNNPAFYALNNATLPVINQLFNMDTSGSTGTGEWGYGIALYQNSKGVVLSGKGIKNASVVGISAQYNSSACVDGGIFTGAGLHGIYATNASNITAQSANVSNATNTGCIADRASVIAAANINASSCKNVGIQANNCSRIDAQSANASSATNYGIISSFGSMVNAYNANATLAGSNGFSASQGGLINAESANCRKNLSVDSASDCSLWHGGIINAGGMTGGLCQTKNVATEHGIIYKQ